MRVHGQYESEGSIVSPEQRTVKTPVVPRDNAIQALTEALPAHTEDIEREYFRSGYFRSICADFYECSRALGYWSEKTSKEGIARSEEYRVLLQELEREVLAWLEATKDLVDPDPDESTEKES